MKFVEIEERIAALSIGEPNSGCQLWLGAIHRSGHGRIKIRDRVDFAHRASWKVHRGPIPDGLYVLHSCDVPSCVNPAHLFLGTHADNMADRRKKGGYARQHLNFRKTA